MNDNTIMVAAAVATGPGVSSQPVPMSIAFAVAASFLTFFVVAVFVVPQVWRF